MDLSVIVFAGCIAGLAALFFFSAWGSRYKTTISTRSAHIAYTVLCRFKQQAVYEQFRLREGFTEVEFEQAVDELNQKIPPQETKSSDIRRGYSPPPYYRSHYTPSSNEGD